MGVCVLISGCRPVSKEPSQATPPAKVATIAQEDRLNTIRLTPEASQRLGIELGAVETKAVTNYRSFGAEATLPGGASIIVSAPIGGTLQTPEASKPLQIGAVVKRSQRIFMLLPLLTPERSVLTPVERVGMAQAKAQLAQTRVDVDGQLQQAIVQVEATRIAWERADRLAREQAGTLRAVDEALAALNLAKKTLAAVEARKKLVDAITLDEAAGSLQPLAIESPKNGVIRALSAEIGEIVATGAPLFEVMQLDPIWIKASIYAGEIEAFDRDQAALVGDLAERDLSKTRAARPIPAPPTATPLAATVDLYFELSNDDGRFHPGERVSVRLATRLSGKSRTIPWSAVVHDINGGQWVYEQTAPQVFVRRRVQIEHVSEGRAVLRDGPAEGTLIVTAGAIELFGTEFGFAK